MKLAPDPVTPDTARADLANRLRAVRHKRGPATLVLSKRCDSERITGKITKVATTDTFCLVNVKGIGRRHVPLDDIERIIEPS